MKVIKLLGIIGSIVSMLFLPLFIGGLVLMYMYPTMVKQIFADEELLVILVFTSISIMLIYYKILPLPYWLFLSLILIVLAIGSTFTAIFLMRIYNRLEDITGNQMFRVVGQLYFLGAPLLVFLVGAIIMSIANLLQLFAFLSSPDSHYSSEIYL